MKATVIIATHRRNELLRWNLHTVANGCDMEQVEVIVLDDSYRKDEACQILAADHGARYLHTGKTKSSDHWRIPGFAFNIGAKHARGEVLVLSCAEVYHPLNTLSLMLSVMTDDAITIPKCIRDDRGEILGALQQNLCPETKKIKRLKALDATLPFFMGMKHQRFIDIGGYDEDFTGVCWDDNDISERLILNGGKYVSVDADVVHLYHPRHNYRSSEIVERWNHNKFLYNQRRGSIFRNKDRKWGSL